MLAIETLDLRKKFIEYEKFFRRKEVEALKGINISVKEGEFFGLLGPNGAGKTTFVNILATLLLPDAGNAKIFGLDVAEDANEVRKFINLCPAYTGFYDEQTVKEDLEIYARMCNAEADLDEYISMVWLDDYKDVNFGKLSSGNRQKVALAKSLISGAKIFLMDELTVGLDPDIALKMRELIKNWNKKNDTTILLTTHNMYEADELCNRIAIIHRGDIVACDTPENLKKSIRDEDCIEIKINEAKDPSKFLEKMSGIKRVGFSRYSITIHVDNAEKRLQPIIKSLLSKNYHIRNVDIREPTLEDVFVKLAGVRLE